ncbi:hypothetical protein PC9H_002195 [Pleurotus ostreatus]|uniref:Uncharacterized protein n=2 Tax=Pleurotus ostreatus TaxID=5322 RepID=A0A067N5I3_PLEO1|nr:uncharacterized protein PC9H_002195 [Pleurotus ostreatus]KAF7419604.1 hypothetical protein PC9H_002195 [Pleurotus ostreatus]KDQ23109.1 hypothetical protein PLEOSDRAFT_1114293 [Pleurotus ostreatus PC15]
MSRIFEGASITNFSGRNIGHSVVDNSQNDTHSNEDTVTFNNCSNDSMQVSKQYRGASGGSTYNENHGSGTFNQANGSQHVHAAAPAVAPGKPSEQEIAQFFQMLLQLAGAGATPGPSPPAQPHLSHQQHIDEAAPPRNKRNNPFLNSVATALPRGGNSQAKQQEEWDRLFSSEDDQVCHDEDEIGGSQAWLGRDRPL